MAHSYPIWHQINACHYNSGKSYGGKENSGETIYVGTSANNSYEHCKILTTMREYNDDKHGPVRVFKTSVNDIILIETHVSVKKRKVIKRRTKLNKIKSL